jgi:CheY-like chemotaxis protein
MVSFWDYTGGEKIVYRSKDVETAYKHFANDYHDLGVAIVPKTSANYKPYQMFAFISYCERSKILPGTRSQDDLSSEYDFNPSELEQLLQMSLEKNCFYAATCAIDLLTTCGVNLLKSKNGKPRTLVEATVAKDRGVRFTALETIMSLAPKEPFAGSSLVAESLIWFAKSEGEKVVLSGHPQMASANQTASLFLGLGYKTEVATTCRELFERAAASPDVEVVVVDARTSQPPVGEFVQAMRQDARTANIPIAILSDESSPGDLRPPLLRVRRNEMTQFDRRSPDNPFRTSLSLTYPRLADEKSAQWVLDDLLEKTADGRRQTAEERLEQAKQALEWLRAIKLAELSGGQKIYHFDDFDSVVLEALRSEVRVQEGLQLATVVKSVAVQSALYEMAANAVYPMELRNQAGEAFEQSIDRFGILLRGQQIQRLYDRYNQCESEPKESQDILGRLLDVVEAKAGK